MKLSQDSVAAAAVYKEFLGTDDFLSLLNLTYCNFNVQKHKPDDRHFQFGLHEPAWWIQKRQHEQRGDWYKHRPTIMSLSQGKTGEKWKAHNLFWRFAPAEGEKCSHSEVLHHAERLKTSQQAWEEQQGVYGDSGVWWNVLEWTTVWVSSTTAVWKHKISEEGGGWAATWL